MSLPSDALADPPHGLGLVTVRPGDRRYHERCDTYLRRGTPAKILLAHNEMDIAEALARARSGHGPLSLRSGGHGISGRSTNDGGLVLDVSALNRVEVLDAPSRIVRIGAGARWGNVARALTPHGLTISSGDSGDVGVGGLAT